MRANGLRASTLGKQTWVLQDWVATGCTTVQSEVTTARPVLSSTHVTGRVCVPPPQITEPLPSAPVTPVKATASEATTRESRIRVARSRSGVRFGDIG